MSTKPVLSDADVRTLSEAWFCLKEKPVVDTDALAKRLGHKNPRSTKNTIAALIKKLDTIRKWEEENAGETTAAVSSPAKPRGRPPASAKAGTAGKAAKSKKRAQPETDEDENNEGETTPTPAPKKRKAPARAAAKKKVIKEESESEAPAGDVSDPEPEPSPKKRATKKNTRSPSQYSMRATRASSVASSALSSGAPSVNSTLSAAKKAPVKKVPVAFQMATVTEAESEDDAADVV